MPMNQSGDGISFVTNETNELLLCTKSLDSIFSMGSVSFGMVNSSKINLELISSFSHSSVSVPVSQNCLRPSDATWSILKRLKLALWLMPNDFEKCAGGRCSGKCLGNNSLFQWPSKVTLYTANESVAHSPPKLSIITLSCPRTTEVTWRKKNILRSISTWTFYTSKHSHITVITEMEFAAIGSWFPQLMGSIIKWRTNLDMWEADERLREVRNVTQPKDSQQINVGLSWFFFCY